MSTVRRRALEKSKIAPLDAAWIDGRRERRHESPPEWMMVVGTNQGRDPYVDKDCFCGGGGLMEQKSRRMRRVVARQEGPKKKVDWTGRDGTGLDGPGRTTSRAHNQVGLSHMLDAPFVMSDRCTAPGDCSGPDVMPGSIAARCAMLEGAIHFAFISTSLRTGLGSF